MMYDVVVIGGGPAGLSAALNLVRARRTVLLVDSNRPRNAPTLASHGFLTRDGISPLELRQLGRNELSAYPEATVRVGAVTALQRLDHGFRVEWRDPHTKEQRRDSSRSVVVATGVTELLPDIKDLRAYYGTAFHSCIECDGYEKKDGPIALVGETSDVAEWALYLSQWNDDVTVFTNASGYVSPDDEERLRERSICVDRRRIDVVEGERSVVTGFLMDDRTRISVRGGFVRPVWQPTTEFLENVDVRFRPGSRTVEVDADGRTNIPGLYAAGDSASLFPSQLIVAAGSGAVVARALSHDLAMGRVP